MDSLDKSAELSYLEGTAIAPEESTSYPTGWQRILNSAATHPDKVAVISMHQSPTLFSIPSVPSPDPSQPPYLRWTYNSLMGGVDRLARGLQANGVVPGTTIVSFLPNGAEYILTRLAAHMTGGLFAPLNPRSLTNKDEVIHLLGLFLSHAPVKRLVVIAEDEEVANKIDGLGNEVEGLKDALKVVASNNSPTTDSSWHPFPSLMTSTPNNPPLSSIDFPNATDETIFCTSGTTSRPKACVWTTAQVSYYTHTLTRQSFTVDDNILCVAPNNHVAGNEAVVDALSFGGTVVFPSARFDLDTFARAAKVEKATFTVVVPTMVLALCRGKTEKIAWLRSIALGGSPISPEVLRLCRDILGCAKVCPVFGNTEGAMIRTGDREIAELVGGSGVDENEGVAVAWGAAPGEAVKICEPGNNDGLVPLGMVGELHISSPGANKGYIGLSNEENDQFYTDATGRAWYNTGDQARLDATGRVYVLGRYKDMIIRGGENIAPAAVEAVLEPTLGHLGIQIVGAPDHEGVAGEVPIAVTEKPVDANTSAVIRQTIVKHMGPAFAPDEILSLKDLSLEDYPRTAVGKVQKHKLAEVVKAYRESRIWSQQQDDSAVALQPSAKNSKDGGSDSGLGSQTLDTVRRIWSHAIGIHDDSKLLAPDTLVAKLPVDSIVVMRVRDRLAKALDGRTLSLAELNKTTTLLDQAVLLDAKFPVDGSSVGLGKGVNAPGSTVGAGPPELEDMMHLVEDATLLEATKEAVASAIAPFGLSWDKSVREVIPASDWNTVSLRLGSVYHMNLKMILATKKKMSKAELRSALRRVVLNNPMMASFLVSDKAKLGNDQALHVVVDLTDDYLDDHVFGDGGVVQTNDELVEFARRQHFPACSDAVPPNPLTKMWLFEVTETGRPAVVFNACHSVYDATFASLVYDDLEAALAHPEAPLRPHVNYKLWADSYFNLRSSPAARAAVTFHVDSIQGLGSHHHALWPPVPPVFAPRNITLPSDGAEGLTHAFDVPGWSNLRHKHPFISPPIPLKAALALFLMKQTSHTHSMFAQVEAERSRWPFLPKSFGEYPASDVSGLTIQSGINLVSFLPDETVLEFLKRMQTTQTLQTKHAAAPRLKIFDALGSPEAIQLHTWIPYTALFNWVGANRPWDKDQYKTFELVNVVISREIFGFMVVCGMILLPPSPETGAEGGVKLWIKLHTTTFGLVEMGGYVRQLEALTNWLVDEGNWERRVDEFRGVDLGC